MENIKYRQKSEMREILHKMGISERKFYLQIGNLNRCMIFMGRIIDSNFYGSSVWDRVNKRYSRLIKERKNSGEDIGVYQKVYRRLMKMAREKSAESCEGNLENFLQ